MSYKNLMTFNVRDLGHLRARKTFKKHYILSKILNVGKINEYNAKIDKPKYNAIVLD